MGQLEYEPEKIFNVNCPSTEKVWRKLYSMVRVIAGKVFGRHFYWYVI